MQKLPFVSFIIATYRQEQFIEAALTAALQQDYQGDMEILISDDASPDNTWDVIQCMLHTPPPPLYSLQNQCITTKEEFGNRR